MFNSLSVMLKILVPRSHFEYLDVNGDKKCQFVVPKFAN